MKTLIIGFILVVMTMLNVNAQTSNPFLKEYNTPFGIPPFNEIQPEHFMPAIENAIKEHNNEIDAIINNTEKPDFNNTVARLDYSGSKLRNITTVFHNLNSSNTNPEIQALAKKIAPVLSAHYDNINLNENLF